MVAFSSSSSIFCQVFRGRSAEGQGDGTGERLVRCPSRQNVRARQRKGKRFVCFAIYLYTIYEFFMLPVPRRRPRRVRGQPNRARIALYFL